MDYNYDRNNNMIDEKEKEKTHANIMKYGWYEEKTHHIIIRLMLK